LLFGFCYKKERLVKNHVLAGNFMGPFGKNKKKRLLVIKIKHIVFVFAANKSWGNPA